MPDFFSFEELAMFANIPEEDLVELAAGLGLSVPAEVDRPALLEAIVVNIAHRARREGLPLSNYDRPDLEALPPEDLRALAKLCGTRPTVDSLLKMGRKVYRRYRRERPKSQVPLMLPMLLAPLARYARRSGNS